MLAFLQQTLGTIVVLLIVIALVALAIRSLVKDRRSGKGICGGNCASCSSCGHGCGSGKMMSDQEIRDAIEQQKRRNQK